MTDTEPKTAPRPRPLFTFRLRTLFLLTTLIAIPLGYIMYERHRCQQQQRADSLWMSQPIHAHSLGGKIRIDIGEVTEEGSIPVRSGWMATLLGDNNGDSIVSIKQCIDYDHTISRSEMYALSHLFNLKELAIPLSQIEQGGFRYLSALHQLEMLDLQKANVSDDNLYYIRRLSKLVQLKLNNTKIGNQGASHLANLTNLKTLHVQQTQIGDEGVKHLSKLTNLEHLDLSDTLVTEKSLNLLAQHQTLKLLALPPDSFSPKSRAELRQRLPKCDIIFAKN